jgi:hypothetical protein
MTSISRFDRTELYIVSETYDNEEINYYIVLDKEYFNLIMVNPIFIHHSIDYIMEFFINNDLRKVIVLVSIPLVDIIRTASLIKNLFPNVLIVSSSYFANLIRNGKCVDSECAMLDVNLEVRGKTVYGNALFVVTNVPYRGSTSLKYKEFLLGYEIKASPFGDVRYICDKRRCIEDEKGWYTRASVKSVGNLGRRRDVP